MIVIFDLDNTLIHTERIKLDVFYAVAQSYGFSVDESKALYQSIRNEKGRVIFSPQTFARELSQRVGVASESIETQLYSAMRNHTEKFIVDGAVDFVQTVAQSGLEMYIMTLGVHAWQEDKIELIGFGEYFPKEKRILPRLDLDEKDAKVIALQEYFGDRILQEESILINDKPTETAELLNAFPHMKALVRWDSEDERYTQSDFETCHEQFEERFLYSQSLRELHTVFEKNI